MNDKEIIKDLISSNHWRVKLGIEVGMPKEQALDQFIAWRVKMKTCQRCEGENYVEFCPIYLICKEADNAGNITRDDNRRRITKITEPEALRAQLSEARKRDTIR